MDVHGTVVANLQPPPRALAFVEAPVRQHAGLCRAWGMPTRPRTFRPASGPGSDADRRARASAYEARRFAESETKRLYGTARWRAIRAEQLSIEPLCRGCMSEGRVEPAIVCDHVEPHRGNVARFWTGPFQSLCTPCHSSAKQREDQSSRRG